MVLAVTGNASYAGGSASGEDRMANVGKVSQTKKKRAYSFYVRPPRIQLNSVFGVLGTIRPTVFWLLLNLEQVYLNYFGFFTGYNFTCRKQIIGQQTGHKCYGKGFLSSWLRPTLLSSLASFIGPVRIHSSSGSILVECGATDVQHSESQAILQQLQPVSRSRLRCVYTSGLSFGLSILRT